MGSETYPGDIEICQCQSLQWPASIRRMRWCIHGGIGRALVYYESFRTKKTFITLNSEYYISTLQIDQKQRALMIRKMSEFTFLCRLCKNWHTLAGCYNYSSTSYINLNIQISYEVPLIEIIIILSKYILDPTTIQKDLAERNNELA